jgi:serine/threonine-protein kinase HipA
LCSFDGEPAIVVSRYDRVLVGDSWLRVHQEDCCQALGRSRDRKYQSDGGPGPREVASLLRAVMTPSGGDAAVRTFVDALAFNWVAGGTDAHAKNYSLLARGSQVRLAPLYDLLSAFPYVKTAPGPRAAGELDAARLALAMKVGRSAALNQIERRDWVDLAGDVGVDADEVLERTRRMIEKAPDAFAEAAADLEPPWAGRSLPRLLVDRVAAHAARCRDALAGRPPLNRRPRGVAR